MENPKDFTVYKIKIDEPLYMLVSARRSSVTMWKKDNITNIFVRHQITHGYNDIEEFRNFGT